jgi:hypothetical protein
MPPIAIPAVPIMLFLINSLRFVIVIVFLKYLFNNYWLYKVFISSFYRNPQVQRGTIPEENDFKTDTAGIC